MSNLHKENTLTFNAASKAELCADLHTALLRGFRERKKCECPVRQREKRQPVWQRVLWPGFITLKLFRILTGIHQGRRIPEPFVLRGPHGCISFLKGSMR